MSNFATDNQGQQILSDSPRSEAGKSVKIADGNGGWKPGTMVGGTAVETK